MSPQRAYQLRNLAAGKCSKCPRPLHNRNHCSYHASYAAKGRKTGRERLKAIAALGTDEYMEVES